MATGLLETGPKLDWTRDNKIFDRYQIWKEKVELIFSSALEESSAKQKVSYLRYWMGEQGIPLIKKWTALGKLDFSNPVEVPATEGARGIPLLSGYILQNYWDLLEAEFRPKGNKLLSVIELWTRSRQGSKTLNEWLTYVYNLVESCNYGDSSERIIRDVLIIGCNSDKAKDKIVRQGEKIKLQEVIEILQLEIEVLQETNKDKELQSLKHYISTGWPAKRSQIPVSLHPYWNFRDELTIEGGILMKNSKVLIPETLKQKYLKQIHQGHQGIEACRSRAREFVFWININNDLKELVEKCDLCQSQQNSTAIIQKYVSDVPPHPWHTLGSDLFYFQRIDFLVIVDYFSKYLIIRKIQNSTSSAVIKELGMIFSEFGKPQIFRSDNGPCYLSQEFRFFMQNWLIEHRTSSPHYPQSNGLAESMVKVSKNLIEKAVRQDLPWNQLLLDYRCTPISSEIPSPAEILFGRKLQSSISILPSQVMNDRISKQRELIAKKEGKFYTNTKDFQDRIKALPFEAGQNVWLQNSDSRKCEEAVIREKCREPSSYMVEIPATGQCFRRNSNFIKPRQSEQKPVSTELQPITGLPEIPQKSPVLQQPAVPSSQATSTVDAIPTVPPLMQNGNSTPRTPRQPRVSRRSTKGIPPTRLGLQK